MSPSMSQPQHNAMEAAAHGSSTLGIPQSVGQDFVKADTVEGIMGMPKGKRKTHRGGGRGKGKGGPGASHHNALNAAMAAGDHASAKKHALNLANALHGHAKGMARMESEPDADDVPPGTIKPIPPTTPANLPKGPAEQGRSFLAKALMGRR